MERWKKIYLDNNKDYRALAPQHKTKILSSIPPEQALILTTQLAQPKQKEPVISEVINHAIEIMQMRRMPYIRSKQTYRRWLVKWMKDNYGDYIWITEGEQGLYNKVLHQWSSFF